MALFCIDEAILAADTEWFSALGKLYYFRGKIILAILEDATSITFPTTLSPEKPEGQLPEFLQRTSTGPPTNATRARVYRSEGDILQEGEATLKQAVSYAESTGDEIRLGKAMSLLAQIFSNYCFSRIAFYNFTFADICHMAHFDPSVVAKNAREAEKAKKAQQEKKKKKQQQREEDRRKEKRRQRQILGSPAVSRSNKHGTDKNILVSGQTNSKGPPPLPSVMTLKVKSPSSFRLSVGSPGSGSGQDSSDSSESSKKRDPSPSRPILSSVFEKPGFASRLSQRRREYVIRMADIIFYAKEALTIATETSNLNLMLKSYLLMAEIQYINDDVVLAKEFFVSFRDHMTSFFMNVHSSLFQGGPPSCLKRLRKLSERALKLLFVLDKETINNNLYMVDFYLNLSSEEELASKTVPRSNSAGTNAKKRRNFKLFEKDTKKIDLSALQEVIAPDSDLEDGCSLLWGYHYYMKRQAYLFSEGKMSSETLRLNNQRCIRKQKKIAALLQANSYHLLPGDSLLHLKSLQFQRSLRLLPPSNDGPTGSDSGLPLIPEKAPKSVPAKKEGSSLEKRLAEFPASMYSRKKVIDQTIIILQLGSDIVYYSPKKGTASFQRISSARYTSDPLSFPVTLTSTEASLTPKYPPDEVTTPRGEEPVFYVKFCLLQKEDASITLVVPANASVADLRDYLCDKENWEYLANSEAHVIKPFKNPSVSKEGESPRSFGLSRITSRRSVDVKKRRHSTSAVSSVSSFVNAAATAVVGSASVHDHEAESASVTFPKDKFVVPVEHSDTFFEDFRAFMELATPWKDEEIDKFPNFSDSTSSSTDDWDAVFTAQKVEEQEDISFSDWDSTSSGSQETTEKDKKDKKEEKNDKVKRASSEPLSPFSVPNSVKKEELFKFSSFSSSLDDSSYSSSSSSSSSSSASSEKKSSPKKEPCPAPASKASGTESDASWSTSDTDIPVFMPKSSEAKELEVKAHSKGSDSSSGEAKSSIEEPGPVPSFVIPPVQTKAVEKRSSFKAKVTPLLSPRGKEKDKKSKSQASREESRPTFHKKNKEEGKTPGTPNYSTPREGNTSKESTLNTWRDTKDRGSSSYREPEKEKEKPEVGNQSHRDLRSQSKKAKDKEGQEALPPRRTSQSVPAKEDTNKAQGSAGHNRKASNLMTKAVLDSICVAREKHTDHTGTKSDYVPVNLTSKLTINDIISSAYESRENSAHSPLKLFLYLSVEVQGSRRAAWDEIISLDHEIADYLAFLVHVPAAATSLTTSTKGMTHSGSTRITPAFTGEKEESSGSSSPAAINSLREISRKLRETFESMAQVLPPTTTTSHDTSPLSEGWTTLQSFRSMTKSKKSMKGSLESLFTPLYIISCQTLQILPWELLTCNLYKNTIRHFTVRDLINASAPLPPVLPRTVGLKKNTDLGLLHPVYRIPPDTEVSRNTETIRNALWNLYIDKTSEWPRHRTATPFPLPSPLVPNGSRVQHYKNKFKLINFVDFSEFVTPQHVTTLLDNANSFAPAIFLFSYADMVEMSDTLIAIRKKEPISTMIFVANAEMKKFIIALLKSIKKTKVSTSRTYSWFPHLISSLGYLQSQLLSPIILFNPPSLYYDYGK
eukprot:TRINITY_DN3125_c0_g1_i1.p1 TRINITY_DN3125_c0_g1~~TRINITY_DN3125_c0_g1_i1.p1  ORF type:complete len:1648 (+),score=383.22 TRINITY_DN3125_c0_g1_i1:141-4946(+)